MCPIAHAPHHPCPPSRSIHYHGSVPITHVPHCSCGLLPMCPITLLPCRPRRVMLHHPYAPSLLFPITHVPNHPTPCVRVPHCSCGLLPMHPITHVPNPDNALLWQCAPSPMCPIVHVPHPPRCPISIFSINQDTCLPKNPQNVHRKCF